MRDLIERSGDDAGGAVGSSRITVFELGQAHGQVVLGARHGPPP